ncbi:MAG: hypothetical protein Phyf2KO_00660 [Phycisphaerales bacterium]
MNSDLSGYINTTEYSNLMGVSNARIWAIARTRDDAPQPVFVHKRAAVWPRDAVHEFVKKYRAPKAKS